MGVRMSHGNCGELSEVIKQILGWQDAAQFAHAGSGEDRDLRLNVLKPTVETGQLWRPDQGEDWIRGGARRCLRLGATDGYRYVDHGTHVTSVGGPRQCHVANLHADRGRRARHDAFGVPWRTGKRTRGWHDNAIETQPGRDTDQQVGAFVTISQVRPYGQLEQLLHLRPP
jgi:hypothetical protein